LSNDILQNELKGSIAVTVESLMKDVAETLQSLYDEVSKETSNDELIRMILETQQKASTQAVNAGFAIRLARPTGDAQREIAEMLETLQLVNDIVLDTLSSTSDAYAYVTQARKILVGVQQMFAMSSIAGGAK
jgi:hypothetical protein